MATSGVHTPPNYTQLSHAFRAPALPVAISGPSVAHPAGAGAPLAYNSLPGSHASTHHEQHSYGSGNLGALPVYAASAPFLPPQAQFAQAGASFEATFDPASPYLVKPAPAV